MYYRQSKKGAKWQKAYISKVFKNRTRMDETYSKILLENTKALSDKDQYLPNTLYKFYAPTSYNILDIRSKRLWMSHPNSFNDPFDSKIGCDSLEYEKRRLLEFIKQTGCVDESASQDGFTTEEMERIIRSSTSMNYSRYYVYRDKEDYKSLPRKLLQQKSEKFNRKVSAFLKDSIEELQLKIDKLREINIRVACFSEFGRYDEFYKKIQMWSHYADNHQGFCIEYDVSSLKSETALTLADHEYYDEKDRYINERIKAITKGGLFPVDYTSRRVNMPVTRLLNMKTDSCGDLSDRNHVDEIIYKTLIVKSSNWSYEKEWRLILDGSICAYYDNRIPFPYIKKIYLGCRMEKTMIDTMLKIGEELGIEVVMMRMDGKEFRLEEESTSNYKWRTERLQWHNPFMK